MKTLSLDPTTFPAPDEEEKKLPDGSDLFVRLAARVDSAMVSENRDTLRNIYKKALATTEAIMDERDKGKVTPLALATATDFAKAMMPARADMARITSPIDIGAVRTLRDSVEAISLLTTLAMQGKLGIGEAQKLISLLETNAKMRWAADLDAADALVKKLEAHRLENPDPPAEPLRWGRHAAAKAEDAVPVDDDGTITPDW